MATKISNNVIALQGSVDDFKHFESNVEVVADTIVLNGLDHRLSHCHIGVQFFDSVDGDTPVVPGAGTINVDIKTPNTEVFEVAPTTNIDATAPITLIADFPVKEVRAIPTVAITTATHWKLIVTQSRN